MPGTTIRAMVPSAPRMAMALPRFWVNKEVITLE